jgi:hypothetical protein
MIHLQINRFKTPALREAAEKTQRRAENDHDREAADAPAQLRGEAVTPLAMALILREPPRKRFWD